MGFTWVFLPPKSSSKPSAAQHPCVVDQYLVNAVSLGRVVVLFQSDNNAVVHILNTQTSRVPCQMRLLCSLLFSAAHHTF